MHVIQIILQIEGAAPWRPWQGNFESANVGCVFCTLGDLVAGGIACGVSLYHFIDAAKSQVSGSG